MGRMINCLLLLIFPLILLHAGGLIQGTPTSSLIDMLLNPQSINVGSFFENIEIAIASIAVSAAIIASVAFGRPDIALKSGVAGFLIIIGWDFIAIWQVLTISGTLTSKYLGALIISPLLIIWVITVFDWWTGRD